MTESSETITTDATASAPAIDTSFRDASLPLDERVERLLAQMTLEEKAGLFFQTMITIDRKSVV